MEKETKVLNENEMNDASFSEENKEENEKTGKKIDLKKVGRNVGIGAAGAVAGMGGAMAAMTLKAEPDPDEPDPDEPIPALPSNALLVKMAHNVNDDMSFDEAFASARKEVGPGGVFIWRGNAYNTYYKEEWESLSSGQKHEFGHVAGRIVPEQESNESEDSLLAKEPEQEDNIISVDSESSYASSSHDDYILPTEHVDTPAEITYIYETATDVTQTHPGVHIDTGGAFPDSAGYNDSSDSLASTDNMDGDMILMG